MLQLNGIKWRTSKLGGQAILLEPIVENGHLEKIHQLYRVIESDKHSPITDIVPAYQSIALFYIHSKKGVFEYLKKIDVSDSSVAVSKTIVVEVDYQQGLDWNRVIANTGFTKSEIIERHSKPIYTVAMIGFVPGFIFLKGLDPNLTVSRLENPRTRIPAGSIGIGGDQTGIYSLESPGGWNIIGKSVQQFFDVKKSPPISIALGDKLKFKPTGN